MIENMKDEKLQFLVWDKKIIIISKIWIHFQINKKFPSYTNSNCGYCSKNVFFNYINN